MDEKTAYAIKCAREYQGWDYAPQFAIYHLSQALDISFKEAKGLFYNAEIDDE